MGDGNVVENKKKPYSHLMSPEKEQINRELKFNQKMNINVLDRKSELTVAFEKFQLAHKKKQQKLKEEKNIMNYKAILKKRLESPPSSQEKCSSPQEDEILK